MFVAVKWAWGSRVDVSFEWADGTHTVNRHTNNARESIASHIYTVPGRYFPSVHIMNYLLDCSSQTLTSNYEDLFWNIAVLYNVSGLRVMPSLIAWNRTEPFLLTVFLDQGTWLNMTVNWNDSTEDFFYVNNITAPATNVC